MKSCRFFPYLVVPFFLVAIAGCSVNSEKEIKTNVSDIRLRREEVTAGSFKLTILSRIVDVNQPINVYIDGDVPGLAPVAAPGTDAKPDEAATLRLAELDTSYNVVFISRPCQFGIDDPFCHIKPGESERYAEIFYRSVDRALDYVVSVVPHPHLNLIGYSGGGAMAAVLAARRHDVDSLRTIAGNLDPNGNGQTHAAEPRNDFIDPLELAPRLALLPQEHFVGGKDEFVTPKMAENFVQAMGPTYCARIIRIPGATHKTGWEEVWTTNVLNTPSCGVFAQN
jgi:pimeloyl-ACP methyl ester carboxylesterase